MHSKENVLASSVPRLLAMGVGIAAWWLFSFTSMGIGSALGWIFDKVGITIVALAPLAVWSIMAALRNGQRHDLTLAYIGTTAQRVGLLGTVIGIVLATIRIGESLSSGAANAVTSALPAVGQALISTAVGFIIAIVCDFFRYLKQRDEAEVHVEDEAGVKP